MAPQIDTTIDATRAADTLAFMKTQSEGHRGIIRPVVLHADLAVNNLASAYWFLYLRDEAEQQVEDSTPWYVVLTPEQDADLFTDSGRPEYFEAITQRMVEYARREHLAVISNEVYERMRDLEIRELERVADAHQQLFYQLFGAPGDDGLLREVFTAIEQCDTPDSTLDFEAAAKATAVVRRRPRLGLRILIALVDELAILDTLLAEDETPDANMQIAVHLQINRELTAAELLKAREYLRWSLTPHAQRGAPPNLVMVEPPENSPENSTE